MNHPVSRPTLAAMTDLEFAQWQATSRVGLQHAIARMDAYLTGRRKRGIHTSTDSTMECDLALFRDLLVALDELNTLRQGAAQAAGHSGDTGMLLMDDSHDGNITP